MEKCLGKWSLGLPRRKWSDFLKRDCTERGNVEGDIT
jgi:hypothetical protein